MHYCTLPSERRLSLKFNSNHNQLRPFDGLNLVPVNTPAPILKQGCRILSGHPELTVDKIMSNPSRIVKQGHFLKNRPRSETSSEPRRVGQNTWLKAPREPLMKVITVGRLRTKHVHIIMSVVFTACRSLSIFTCPVSSSRTRRMCTDNEIAMPAI